MTAITASSWPVASDAPLALWLVDLSAPVEASAFGWLDDHENDRAARFRSALDRSRYRAAHVALRLVIDRCCGIAPARQRYDHDALGKTRLAGRSPWHFSLSYAGDRALIGVARGAAIGVDIERPRAIEDADDLIRLHFDREEQHCYAGLPSTLRNAAFLRGWTRKEACLKASGAGLHIAPASIPTGFDGAGQLDVDGQRIALASFETDGLVAAWARVADDQ